MHTITFSNRPPVTVSDDVWSSKITLRDDYAHLDFGSDLVALVGPTGKGNYVLYHYYKGAYENDGWRRTCLGIGSLAVVLAALDCEEYRDAHNAAVEEDLIVGEEV